MYRFIRPIIAIALVTSCGPGTVEVSECEDCTALQLTAEDCDAQNCNGHGACNFEAQNCDCDEGYRGNRCDKCSSGYERDGSLCVPQGACTPSCAPDDCGLVDDGCGGTIDCGECSCEELSCQPGECGTIQDGCGGTIDCGECPCEELSCQPGECGTKQDGCGGTIDCGACSGETCESAPGANPLGLRIPDTAAPGDDIVPWVGCSQTREAGQGYEDLGGSRTGWGPFGGCSIDEWLIEGGDCRNGLLSWVANTLRADRTVVTDVMFQICIRSVKEGTYDYGQIITVAQYIEQTFPSAQNIYVFGLEDFEPGTCRGATDQQQATTRAWAEQLAENTDGLSATYHSVNNLGSLDPTTTWEDDCHPGHLNSEGFDEGNGRLIVGETLCDLLGDCDPVRCADAPAIDPFQ